MIINKFLSIVLLILSLTNVSAQDSFQKGYIVTLNNDTINGLVEYRSNSKNYKSCMFRNQNSVDKNYYPNEIIAYGYSDDKAFSSQIAQNSFVEVLVTGELSLYKSSGKFYLKKDTSVFVLSSKMAKVEINGQEVMKRDDSWRGIIASVIRDCLNSTAGNYTKTSLTEKSLTQLVIKYNNCKGSPSIQYKNSKKWTLFNYGVLMGVASSTIEAEDGSGGFFPYLNESFSSVDPSIGFLVAISSPRVSNRMSFQAELHFLRASYSGSAEVDNIISQDSYNTFIDLSTLSMPLSLKYSLEKNKYGAYLNLGVNYDYHIITDTEVFGERVTGNSVEVIANEDLLDIRQGRIGFWGGIGAFRTFKNFNLGVDFRYYRMSSLTETASSTAGSTGFTTDYNRISFGLIFIKK